MRDVFAASLAHARNSSAVRSTTATRVGGAGASPAESGVARANATRQARRSARVTTELSHAAPRRPPLPQADLDRRLRREVDLHPATLHVRGRDADLVAAG